MQISPTNSPYLTGKTSSFHGNRTERENKRETETEGRMDVRGVERGELTETGKWETRLLFFLSRTRRSNVTSDGGEAARYQQRLWARGNVPLYHHEKERTGPRLGEIAACALGLCDPATPGVKLECSLKRVSECSINPSEPLFRESTVGMMGMGKQQDNCVWTADTVEHHMRVMFFWRPSSDRWATEL